MRRRQVRVKVTKMELVQRDRSHQEHLLIIRNPFLLKLLKEKKVRKKKQSLRSIHIRFLT
jgi:hypothetical protein